jgi:uncharacterized repeat protein (TIGR03899 family)
MKIESDHRPLPIVATKKPQPNKKPDKTIQLKSDASEVLHKQSTQRRIVQWFSQVGVQRGMSGKQALDTDEKIQRRSKVSAQRKLNNLEQILGRALDFCLEDLSNDNLDPDWFFSFVNMAEEIYSPAMQELWGKIFAVETSRPGTFSLRSLQTLKQLTQKDAKLFRAAVSLASRKKGESTPKLILGYYQKPSLWSVFRIPKEHQLNLAVYGLGYPSLLSLMDLGLIHPSEIESGELPLDVKTEWRCAGQHLHLSANKRGTTLVYYKFTATGAELYQLVAGHRHASYIDALKLNLANAFDIG